MIIPRPDLSKGSSTQMQIQKKFAVDGRDQDARHKIRGLDFPGAPPAPRRAASAEPLGSRV
jgi:hypothetical protein